MPKPLFTKLVAQVAIGFFCILFGGIYGLLSHDQILFVLSIFICIGSFIRAAGLYRLIRTNSYISLAGLCTKREPTMFKRSLHIFFTSTDEKEYQFTLDKSSKLLQGRYYRLYFRTTKNSPISFEDFLGFEELTNLDTEEKTDLR